MANLNQAIRLQKLIEDHNRALNALNKARVPRHVHNLYPTEWKHNQYHSYPVESRRPKTAEHKAMYNRYRQAENNYNRVYYNLKRALGIVLKNNNNNNLYPSYNWNHRRRFSHWTATGNGNALRPFRAARTIQKHVRGTHLRARAGAHNPTTPVGYLLQMKRMIRNFRSN